MRFQGRDTELAAIMERWRRVTDMKAPAAQVVLLRAERGIGKTRLALEVRQALRTTMQSDVGDGYWPAVPPTAAEIDVNADPHHCNFERPIPFMWWGLRAADPGTQNAIAGNAISTYEPWLAPQLVALAVRARIVQTGKAILDVWREIGAGELASWTGYGTVMTLGQGLLQTASIVFGAVDARGAGAARNAMHRRQTDRVNDILEELEGVFNPRALSFARTPGVIFIDDAQFMTCDPGLAAFTEVLLQRAIEQSWPVMVLVTHWRRELDLDLSRDGTSFAKILNAARTGGAAFLDGSNLLDLDLQPLPDLSIPLADACPGLLPPQAQALLAHAGGNPRHLEQIIVFLRENEDYFEHLDTSAALTEEGLAKALGETHDLFKVVLRRLRDAPLEVQEAICIASLQGLRFVSSVVGDVMLAHLGKPPGSALEVAANPYSMIHAEAAGQIAAFSERLFHLVAARRRRSLPALADANALRRALKAALADRLDDPSFDATADTQTRALTYAVVAQVFADRDAERAIKLAALARLTRLESERGAHRAAVAAAQQFAAVVRDDDFAGPAEIAHAAGIIATHLVEDGAAADALRLLTPALDELRGAVDDAPSARLLSSLCHAFLAQVEIASALAVPADELAAAQAAVAMARRGAARFGSAFAASLLPGALGTLGTVLQSRGDLAAAVSALDEAIIAARAAQRGTPDAASDVTLAELLSRASYVRELAGDYESAEADQRAAHTLCEGMLARIRSASNFMALSQSHRRLALITARTAAIDTALEHAQASTRAAREACKIGDTPRARKALFQALVMSGLVAMRAGGGTANVAAQSEALALATALDEQLGTPDSLADRATACLTLAQAHEAVGDSAPAAVSYGEAVAHRRRFLARTDTPMAVAQLAVALSYAGRIAHRTDDIDTAQARHGEAIKLYKRALERSNAAAIRQSYVLGLTLFAELANDMGAYQGAAILYFEAVEQLRGLHALGGNAENAATLVRCLGKLADAVVAMGEPASAIQFHQESVTVARAMRDAVPGRAADLRFADTLLRHARAVVGHDPETADAACTEGLGVLYGVAGAEYEAAQLLCVRAEIAKAAGRDADLATILADIRSMLPALTNDSAEDMAAALAALTAAS